MIEVADMVLKLLVAGVLGGIVGYEREVHEHPAGLRTHILVCMGATLITMISVSFKPPVGDPGRIAAQIVSGIGFLGAGTILRQGNIVRGLTTAASLWAVAGIGMAVGVGGVFYWVAAVATGIIFITLSTIRILEPNFGKGTAHKLYIEFPVGSEGVLGDMIHDLTEMGASVHAVKGVKTTYEGRSGYNLDIVLPRKMKAEDVVERISRETGLERFEWT